MTFKKYSHTNYWKGGVHSTIKLYCRDVALVNGIYSIFFSLLKVHVAMDSEVADHCQSFALSDPDNGLFQKKCSHDHVEICCECYKLNKVPADIKIACSKLVSEEEREDTMCMF